MTNSNFDPKHDYPKVEESFAEYFNKYAVAFPDIQTFIKELSRFIIRQALFFDGLPTINTQLFMANEKTEETTLIANLPFPPAIAHIIIHCLQQGSLGDLTSTYWFLKFQTTFHLWGRNTVLDKKMNKRRYLYTQPDGSVIYIERFDIAYFSRVREEEINLPTNKDGVIGKSVTITKIRADNTCELVKNVMFLADPQGEELFDKNDPHIQIRYDKTDAEIEAEIDLMKLPFEVYGVLNTYNTISSKKINLTLIETLPLIETLLRKARKETVDILLPQTVDTLLPQNEWRALHQALSQIDWNQLALDMGEKRFAIHYQIAGKIISKSNEEENKILELSLAEYPINGVFNTFQERYNIPKSCNDLQFKLAIKHAQEEFNHFQILINNILKEMVPKLDYINKFIDFEKACRDLKHTSDTPSKNDLEKAGLAFWKVVEEIKNGKELSTDELFALTQVVALTNLLVSKLASPGWDIDSARFNIELYKNELTNYDGKYQKSATLDKVATSVGVTGSAGALMIASNAIPAVAGLFTFFTPGVIAGAAFTSATLVAKGIHGWMQAKHGELWRAGEEVVNVANANLQRLSVKHANH